MDERSPLLPAHGAVQDRRLSKLQQDEEANSIVKSHVTVEEQAMAHSTIGERLAYNDYTTIDFLHDLVRHSSRAEREWWLMPTCRSRTPTAIASSTVGKAYGTRLLPSSTRPPVGSPLPLSGL